jgi:hypothetical protein
VGVVGAEGGVVGQGVGREDLHAAVLQSSYFLRRQRARFPPIVLSPILEPNLVFRSAIDQCLGTNSRSGGGDERAMG